VSKKYQSSEIDTSRLAVSETVNVALSEIAEDMREGLLALAVGTGLQVTTPSGPRPATVAAPGR